jgi:thiosulfate reductase cytochrome b subunit
VCICCFTFYLITTGETVTSNLRSMLTGYEELEEKDEEKETSEH